MLWMQANIFLLPAGINIAKGKSQRTSVFNMVYTEVAHAIWIRRNMRIVEQRNKGNDVIVTEITYICNIRAATIARNLVQKLMIDTYIVDDSVVSLVNSFECLASTFVLL